MCIVVVKQKGVDFPTWRTMENCFKRNPDGAGFMWNGEDGQVHIQKGFMDFSSFKKALKIAKRQMNIDKTSVVMHFRIKTHGEVSRECCHPFPLEGELGRLRKTECIAKVGVAHNGIILNRNTNAKKSDTMDYILGVLYPIYKLDENIISNKYSKRLIDETIDGCKLAILDGNGNVGLIGHWVYDDGISYSNGTYKPITYGYLGSTSVSSDWKLDKKTGSYVYDANLAEQYGFGYDIADDYDAYDECNDWTWVDDYAEERELFKKTMNEDWACNRCLDRLACINNMTWFCKTKQESENLASWLEEEADVIERYGL